MSLLDTIVEKKREEVASAKRNTPILSLEESEHFHRKCFSLRQFILDPGKTGIIAEFKRKSPSKGMINNLASVSDVTNGYADAGASALSVLTDTDFFSGFNRDLEEARKTNKLPILRKDFTIDEFQILEAKALGADVILLIAAILTPEKIKQLARTARAVGLNVLLEVHSKEELERSLCDELDAVGVNNRNLADFTVSIDHSYDLVNLIPDQFLKISESGISDPKVIDQLRNAGFDGFLIGENFMKEPDPGRAMKDFVSQLTAASK